MKREITRADCENGTGYRLKLIETGSYWRVEVFNPEGTNIFNQKLTPTAGAALDAMQVYFDGQQLHHTGIALRVHAEAEMKFSGQEATT